jgi:hypothetical protein
MVELGYYLACPPSFPEPLLVDLDYLLLTDPAIPWFDYSGCALLARYFLCTRKESNQGFLP